MDLFPRVVLRLGPLAITDTVLVSLAVSLFLVVLGLVARLAPSARRSAETIYEALEQSVQGLVDIDVAPLVPLILTLWLFIGVANLVGLVPGVASPTRDLALTVSLSVIAFASGHLYAFKTRGIGYLRHYFEPSPVLLPFNVIGELSRTVALALRLFGNMLSGSLIGAIVVYLVGLLLPVPLLLLSVLTSLVQAYIFGVLTLVFAASSAEAVTRSRDAGKAPDTTPPTTPPAPGRSEAPPRKDTP